MRPCGRRGRLEKRTACEGAATVSGAADLLVVPLERRGERGVDHGADVRLVDPHPERDRRHDDVELPREEGALDGLSLLGVEPGVVGRGAARRAELGGERLGVLPRRRVENRGTARTVAEEGDRRCVPLTRGALDHLDREVRPAEPVDEARRLVEAELGGDVVLHRRRRGGSERDDGGGAKEGEALAEHPVVGAEVMAPLRNAVRFVDRDEGRLSPREHLRKAGDAEPLRRDEEEVERAVEVGAASEARRFARAPGVDPLCAEALRHELRDLILHQGDEWTDDEGRAAAGEPGELVAERLAGPRRP